MPRLANAAFFAFLVVSMPVFAASDAAASSATCAKEGGCAAQNPSIENDEAASLLHLSTRHDQVQSVSSLEGCSRGPGGKGQHWSGKPFTLAGKSIYFLLTDRFGRTDGIDLACNDTTNPDQNWCGGTISGITANLDYIQGMGFDCIWMTPVIKQYEGLDGGSGSAYHGYWMYDLYKIDPNFGTEQDLKDLSDALHSRGMCLVMDMVVNHMGPIHSTADLNKIYPFSDPSHYHTLLAKQVPDNDNSRWGIFQDYVSKADSKSSTQPPCCPVSSFDGAGSFPPPDIKGCTVGTFCLGYDEQVILDGWFIDLGDLKQENSFVRKTLLDWAHCLVKTYSIDAIRLDTAPYVPRDFLAELQEAAGVEIIGEVTTINQTFHASYTNNPPGARRSMKVLDGLLNFPIFEYSVPAFCGTEAPHGTLNLEALARVYQQQQTEGLYTNLDLLGNFVDNHDWVPRVRKACHKDDSRIANALAWTFFARGMPIVYYGTEVPMWGPIPGHIESRDSLWDTGYPTTGTWYKYIKLLNQVRKQNPVLVAGEAKVMDSSKTSLTLRRGSFKEHSAWVYLNNVCSGDAGNPIVYPKGPPRQAGQWIDALTGTPAKINARGEYTAPDAAPKVLVLQTKA